MPLSLLKEDFSKAKILYERGDENFRQTLRAKAGSLQKGGSSGLVLDIGVFDGRSVRALMETGYTVRGLEVLTFEKVLEEIVRVARARNLGADEFEEMKRVLESVRDRISFNTDIRDVLPGHPRYLLYDYVTAFLPNPRVASLFILRAKDFLKEGGGLLLTLDNPLLAKAAAAILEMEGWAFLCAEMAPQSHPPTLQAQGLTGPYYLAFCMKGPGFRERQDALVEDKALREKRRALFDAVDVLFNAMHLEGSLRGKPVGKKYQSIQELLRAIFNLRDQINLATLNYAALSQFAGEARQAMTSFEPLFDFVWTTTLL